MPSGSFIPVFKIGAALGRMVGELMHLWFPTGIRYGGQHALIIPGRIHPGMISCLASTHINHIITNFKHLI